MNDRFKFRVWQTELKEPKMKYNSGLVINNNEIIEDGCVVMQCTGLKDKNGKLIYEGDIVRVGKSVFEIVKEIGCFMLATKTNIEAIHSFPNSWNDNVYPLGQLYFEYENEENYINQLEVIGNIYENPELLQECE